MSESAEQPSPEPYKEPSREDVITWCRKLINAPNTHRPRVSDKLKAMELVAKVCGMTSPEGLAITNNFNSPVHIELQTVIAKMRGSQLPAPKPAQAIEISNNQPTQNK